MDIKTNMSGPDTTVGRGVSTDGVDHWLKDIVEMYGDKEIDRHAIDAILVDVLELVPRLVELDQRRKCAKLSNIERDAWKDRVEKDGKTIDRLLAERDREAKRAERLKNRLDAAGRCLRSIINVHEGSDALAFCKSVARDAIICECETPCATCSCHIMENGARWEDPNCPIHFPTENDRRRGREIKSQMDEESAKEIPDANEALHQDWRDAMEGK